MRPPAKRTEALLVALLLAIAVARVCATYGVYSQTFDEPAHIASGLEWLDRKTYVSLPINPPLARVFEAVGPLLDGARYIPASDALLSGNRALYSGDYQRRLTLARLGNLPFLLAAGLVVWWWARRLGGGWAGLVALLLFTNLPPVLAHAGLATPDLACAVSIAAALAAFALCLENPRPRSAVILGAALAFAVLTKFSSLFFVPAGVAAILIVKLLEYRRLSAGPGSGGRPEAGGTRWLLRALAAVAVSLVVASILIWAAYRFSTIEPSRVDELVIADSPLRPLLRGAASIGAPLPAPELIAGVGMLMSMNRHVSYPNYFLGRADPDGHPLYFPLLLLVKTPLPFVLLWLAAIALAWRHAALRMPVAISLAMLLCGFLVKWQAGSRYLLPIYPIAAIAAGLAAIELWDRGRVWRFLIALALLSQVIASAAAHPDYLPYFNVLAGRHPERIAIDSDLDWGQDLLRLRGAVQELGIRELHTAYFGTADPRRHDLGAPVHLLAPHERRTGWIAVSESHLHPIWTDGYLWINAYKPVRRVGHSIWLYRIAGVANGPSPPLRGPSPR